MVTQTAVIPQYAIVLFISPQPVDAVFPSNYGQPEGCERDKCTLYVEWRNNGDDFIDFRMKGDSNGWIALGVSSENTPLKTVCV